MRVIVQRQFVPVERAANPHSLIACATVAAPTVPTLKCGSQRFLHRSKSGRVEVTTHKPTMTLTLHLNDAPPDASAGMHGRRMRRLRSHRLALHSMSPFLQPVRHNFVYHHDTAFDE